MKSELKRPFAKAQELRRRGELESARKLLVDLARRDPKSAAIFSVLGDLCWDMGRLDEAVGAFGLAVKLKPKLEAASLGLFHCLWESGKFEEALEEIKRFQSISNSTDYEAIIEEMKDKLT